MVVNEPVQPIVVVVVMIMAGLLDVVKALEVDGLLLWLRISVVVASEVLTVTVVSVERELLEASIDSLVLVLVIGAEELFGLLELDLSSTISRVVELLLVVVTADSAVEEVVTLARSVVEETVEELAVDGVST